MLIKKKYFISPIYLYNIKFFHVAIWQHPATRGKNDTEFTFGFFELSVPLFASLICLSHIEKKNPTNTQVLKIIALKN